MMKKLLLCLILSLNFYMGKSQDFNSEFNNLFLNLPIKDSIENIINGEFGYTFYKKDSKLNDGYYNNIVLYYFPFSNHSYFKDIPGVFAIIKTMHKDSTITYKIHLAFAFDSEENQMKGYESVKEKFIKCSDRINSSELKDDKDKVYGYTTEIEFEDTKVELVAYKHKKKQAHQVQVEYEFQKK